MTKEPDTDQTKIALINNNISYIQKDISEIKGSIEKLAGVYITKLQFDDLQKSLEDRLNRVERSGNIWKVISPLLSSVITATITFLFINYIQNNKL